MVETLFVLPVLLVFILGIIEFSYAYRAKSTLNHAAMAVARTGSITNACKPAMDRQIILSMVPLFMDADRSPLQLSVNALTPDLVNRINIATQLDIISPTLKIFDAFKQDLMLSAGQIGDCGDKSLKPMKLNTVIPNDNLRFRTSATKVIDGRHVSIQDANLLKIKLRYCHELVTPVLDRAIELAQRLIPDSFFGAERRVFLTACTNGGGTMNPAAPFQRRFVVLTADAIVHMQTPVMGRFLDQ
ncbi:TadE/TadG family type IV pilus assembly protein [Allohahella sp. A8]|uniref:TadE/TadG family type IV pilus assembly protein n=1 Tax=Allohahella sp. A8 TaxID=3141461 RepID=UPI003A7FBF32